MNRKSRLVIIGGDVKITFFLARLPQVITGLHSNPQVSGLTKKHLKAYRHLWINCGFAFQDQGKRVAAYIEALCGFGDSRSKWSYDLIAKNCTGMSRIIHCHDFVSSVIIFIVDNFNICTCKAESNPPVGLNCDRPDIVSVPFQAVQVKAGKGQLPRLGCIIQGSKNMLQSVSMSWLNTSLATCAIKLSQTFVKKTLNHGIIGIFHLPVDTFRTIWFPSSSLGTYF